MRHLRTLSIVAVVGMACWVSASLGSAATHADGARNTIRLKPGHYTFHLGGRVNVGDEVLCVTRKGRPTGGGFGPKPGNGVGSSTGFSLVVSESGKVKITCPAHPGNA
jgi:hypothetical protein